MKDFLYAIFCIGVFLIGMIVAADVAVQVRHKLTGSPLAHKVFQSIIDAKEETIKAQLLTIKSQRAVINAQRVELTKAKKKVEALEAALMEGGETDGGQTDQRKGSDGSRQR